MRNFTIHHGHVLDILRGMEGESVHCVVTSPPYWGLRDYGTDGQIGLEKTPEDYVAVMVEIFREVKRILRNDGTLWLNLGDSYAGSWGNYWPQTKDGNGMRERRDSWRRESYEGTERYRPPTALRPNEAAAMGLKPKDLVGIPWRVAFALQADGWWLRSDIIWSKPNPMPESVTDRPTKSHEYIFLLTKNERYFFDAEAVKEPQTESTRQRSAYGWNGRTDDGSNGARTGSTFKRMAETGELIGTIPSDGRRNIRSVWTLATNPFPDAHFAVFPPEIPRRCILAGTREGGTVLDPFCGSGTTGLVALRHNRKFIGIELNADYVAMAERRITNDAPLFNCQIA